MDRIRQMLTEAIFEVFERMLFIFLEPSEEPGAGLDLEAVIRYDGGALKGDITMQLPRSLASAMAQNLLGLAEGAVTPIQAEDCAKEALNMICGNFLSKFDSGRIFHLSIPELGPELGPEPGAGQKAPRAGEGICRQDFNSDQGALGIVLTLSGQ